MVVVGCVYRHHNTHCLLWHHAFPVFLLLPWLHIWLLSVGLSRVFSGPFLVSLCVAPLCHLIYVFVASMIIVRGVAPMSLSLVQSFCWTLNISIQSSSNFVQNLCKSEKEIRTFPTNVYTASISSLRTDIMIQSLAFTANPDIILNVFITSFAD